MANKVHFLRRLQKLTYAHNFVFVCPGVLKFTGLLDTKILSSFSWNLEIFPKWAILVHFFVLKACSEVMKPFHSWKLFIFYNFFFEFWIIQVIISSPVKNIIIGPYLAIFVHFLLQKLLITHVIQYAKHIYLIMWYCREICNSFELQMRVY